MQVPVFYPDSETDSLQLNEKIFSVAFNEPLVHQLIVGYGAGARSGTRAQKNRAAVRGGGIKPWRQKGSGRARAGTIRSPLWRGGGKVFPATTQDFSQKMNKKAYSKGMCAIFSELLRQNRLRVIRDFQIPTPKTKDFLAYLERFSVQKPVLILTNQMDKNVHLGSRNVPGVEVQLAKHVGPHALVKHESVLITVDALHHVEERLV